MKKTTLIAVTMLFAATLAVGQTTMTTSANDNCVGNLQHRTRIMVSINTTATVLLITGQAGVKFSFCLIQIGPLGTATNVALVEGTGPSCATGTLGIAGGPTAATGWNFIVGGQIVIGTGANTVTTTKVAGNNVCLLLSAANQVSGSILYAP